MGMPWWHWVIGICEFLAVYLPGHWWMSRREHRRFERALTAKADEDLDASTVERKLQETRKQMADLQRMHDRFATRGKDKIKKEIYQQLSETAPEAQHAIPLVGDQLGGITFAGVLNTFDELPYPGTEGDAYYVRNINRAYAWIDGEYHRYSGANFHVPWPKPAIPVPAPWAL